MVLKFYTTSAIRNVQKQGAMRTLYKRAMSSTAPEPLKPQTRSPIEIRPFSELGGANHGWLNTRHHFSFADYYDPKRMGWGALRVINDDIVQPMSGFPPHPHRNMEIISYLVEPHEHPATSREEGGEGISHQDSAGNRGVTEPGDVQVMSVGSDGVVHSEFHPNPDGKQTTNLFQIWVVPDHLEKKSTWGTRHFPKEDRKAGFQILASGFKEDQPAALPINSSTRVAGVTLEKGQSATYKLGADRLGYAVTVRGSATINGQNMNSHDGAAIRDTDELTFTGTDEPTEILLIDTHPLMRGKL